MNSGIAHELNNPLTGIELNVQNLLATLQIADIIQVTHRAKSNIATVLRKNMEEI